MTTRAGVGPLIATVVSAAATFLAAGLVIQFALGGSQAAQEELRGGVQIDDERAMYQLIMYDALIAYQCDSSAGGNLDATGNNDWASWKTYKRAAQADPNDDFTFQDLNESFRGDELGCYGTETSIGGKGIYEAVHPSSREWRNDQEGEHSRIRWTVNSSDPIELKECIWFDQTAQFGIGANNPSKGWGEGGITDMLFYMTKNQETNSHDYLVHNDRLKDNPDCQELHVNLFTGGSGGDGSLQGNFLTVSFINADGAARYDRTHSHSQVDYPAEDDSVGNRIRGPDTWANHDDGASISGSQFDLYGFKLCPGARGYIQTNTGWTWPGFDNSLYDSGKTVHDYMKRSEPPYYPDKLPGRGDKEKYSNQDDTQDNSVHPVIVIEDVGDTSNC